MLNYLRLRYDEFCCITIVAAVFVIIIIFVLIQRLLNRRVLYKMYTYYKFIYLRKEIKFFHTLIDAEPWLLMFVRIS